MPASEKRGQRLPPSKSATAAPGAACFQIVAVEFAGVVDNRRLEMLTYTDSARSIARAFRFNNAVAADVLTV